MAAPAPTIPPSVPVVQLPEDLRAETIAKLAQVAAVMDSGGDPAVLASIKDPPGVVALALLSGLLAIVIIIIAQIGNYYEIRNNWAHYQCMPSVAPFAKFYGHDLAATMNFCIQQQVKEHSGEVIAPIYKGVMEVQQVVDGVFTKVEAVEGGIMGLIKGFENFVVNFVNSFRLLGVQVRVMLIRIKEIFARVHGIFMAFVFAAISAITFGENLVCNPLTVFVGTIAGVDICCFAPETNVHMADGSQRPIREVQIGDLLADGGRVTSTFVFDGAAVDMVSIQGVHVSTNHSLQGPDGQWVAGGDHPAATPVPSRSRIHCLSTTTNTIPVVPLSGAAPLFFTDYEETSDPAVAAAAQAAAMRELSGYSGVVQPDFSLGVDPAAHVAVPGGWKRLGDLQVGDTLANGTRVTGIVREFCRDVRRSPCGLLCSAAQLVHGLMGNWFRAGERWESAEAAELCHLFMDNNSSIMIASKSELWAIRDYQEWHGPTTQQPYDRYLKSDMGARPDTPRPNDDDDCLFQD